MDAKAGGGGTEERDEPGIQEREEEYVMRQIDEIWGIAGYLRDALVGVW